MVAAPAVAAAPLTWLASGKEGTLKKYRSIHHFGLVLTFVVLLFGLTAASVAAALGASSFEGNDGNLVAGGGTDWDNVANRQDGVDLPSGSTDDSFQQAKEDDEDPSIGFGSIPIWQETSRMEAKRQLMWLTAVTALLKRCLRDGT